MPLAEPPGLDVGRALGAWAEGMRSQARFAGWEIKFKGVQKWPGACAVVEVAGPDLVATLCAWPNGCVDLDALRCRDEHLVQRHEEVPTVNELLRVLTTLEETVLSLAAGETP